jgi:hypothetical protein
MPCINDFLWDRFVQNITAHNLQYKFIFKIILPITLFYSNQLVFCITKLLTSFLKIQFLLRRIIKYAVLVNIFVWHVQQIFMFLYEFMFFIQKIVIAAIFLDISFYYSINSPACFISWTMGIGNIISFQRLYGMASTRSQTSDVGNSGIAGAGKM